MPDQPHSMIWRMWADRRSNVYLGPRPQPGRMPAVKVSLHCPTGRWPNGKRHVGQTSEHMRETRPGEPGYLRHWREWEGDLALSDHFHLAYRLVFPRTHLRPTELPASQRRLVLAIDPTWPEPVSAHQSLMLDFVFQVAGPLPQIGQPVPPELEIEGTALGPIQRWSLSDGRHVYLVTRIGECPPFRGLRAVAMQLKETIERENLLVNRSPCDLRITLPYEHGEGIHSCAELCWEELMRL